MHDPYRTPQPEAGLPVNHLVPQAIKPFGILHLVFGGLGILTLIFNLLSTLFQKKLLEMGSAGQVEAIDAQMAMTEKLQPYTYLSILLSVILTAFIIRAGLALVKTKKNAVKCSNQYVAVSLLVKVVLLLISIFVMMPAMNEMYEGMLADAGPGSDQIQSMAKIGGAVSAVATPVLSSIYPILAFIFLNKKPVKDYLAAQGK